ncbi:MAG: hypothetical protein A3H72_01475 [Candidatus Doudnabacteria bacterium RIFCSPLOWO2_02_FULL_48_8]|uniref:VanZ-like domain-containing protein n=1 Tax=Candidatus Doudnabacteria bacterium RIFCSPHIGHO2_01_FULL_46_24 TaxID=1817825 RepID=A0A1F5NUS7_9BACT|nr:MAG: hypothetical protein A2720_00995 [Candidatus Doudnabacteria bacterium RIFCSPHIGHO2_01_FULL_46_24]OGE95418.1 MAG: hypothetical protein A3H72_01475 [Candidatus Doudnabacteria bacterium RIFCSPLOWO2_02_FULL_48_8]OGE95469.1 MAG: hypothetical protein A3E98_01080 [Candidatus Doudnabacteria bacterium RIFCSPHIGHO2_12_FULL_48_11]
MITARRIVLWFAAILIVHVVAVYLDLYDRIPNIDIPMHFLGGGAVSLISIYLTKNSKFKTWQYLIFVLGFTIIVGIGWEYFEFAVDQIFEDKFGWNRMTLRDTLGDLLYDGLGATIFWVVYKDRI